MQFFFLPEKNLSRYFCDVKIQGTDNATYMRLDFCHLLRMPILLPAALVISRMNGFL